MNSIDLTKQYYINNSKEYVTSTLSVNMQEHYDRFVPRLNEGAKILDVGFGSGRDMLYFASQGYDVKGIDIVEDFVSLGKENGLSVSLCDFHNIPYVNEFDGVWACASLLHSNDLTLALKNIHKVLKTGGCAYISMKYGEGTQIDNGRFYQFVNEETLANYCSNASLIIDKIYISQDLMNRSNNWINAVLIKK